MLNSTSNPAKNQVMDELWKKITIVLPKPDDLIEARYLERSAARAFFDLGPIGTGMVYGREYMVARDIIKGLKPGDKVMAKVLESENEEGCVELSLREAGRDLRSEEHTSELHSQ